MKNIKMRINNDKNSICQNCGEKWKNVLEMYDIMIFDERHIICKSCNQELFTKILKADCLYNSKLKSSEDVARKRNFDERQNK